MVLTFLSFASELFGKLSFAIADFFLNFFNSFIYCTLAASEQTLLGNYLLAALIIFSFIAMTFLLGILITYMTVIAIEVATVAARIITFSVSFLSFYYGWGALSSACKEEL